MKRRLRLQMSRTIDWQTKKQTARAGHWLAVLFWEMIIKYNH